MFPYTYPRKPIKFQIIEQKRTQFLKTRIKIHEKVEKQVEIYEKQIF